jgi:glucose/arabinose dehydrogenase
MKWMPSTLTTTAAAAVTLLVMIVISVMISPNSLSSINAQSPAGSEESKLKVEAVASNLKIPWSIAFAPDGRIFFTERVGNLRVIENGTLKEQPVAKIGVATLGEGGLLGLALDPNFEKNHFVYLYYTYYATFFAPANRVSRFTEKDDALMKEQVLLDKIPAASNHDGGRIKFGPDGKLYVTTGDAANGRSSQDLGSLAGKILRINSDGSIPEDNPFSGSPVYSYGNRNPQGLDWDPSTGKLVETEHGPSGEMGLYAHDEINVIEPGKNYGWPNVIGKANDTRYVDPILETGAVTWAPSGASFYHGDKIPDWKNKFLVATLRGQHLEVLQLDIKDNKVISSEAIFQDTYGRLRDVEEGPDGYLYILTSNQDGRGSPAADDDKILRISLQALP